MTNSDGSNKICSATATEHRCESWNNHRTQNCKVYTTRRKTASVTMIMQQNHRHPQQQLIQRCIVTYSSAHTLAGTTSCVKYQLSSLSTAAAANRVTRGARMSRRPALIAVDSSCLMQASNTSRSADMSAAKGSAARPRSHNSISLTQKGSSQHCAMMEQHVWL